MGVYIEALILYAVLFLPGSLGRPVLEEPAVFSVTGELIRIILYNIPSLALIWYLLLQKRTLKAWGIGPPLRKDLLPAMLALPSLILIGFIIALISPHFSGISGEPGIVFPSAFPAWILLFCSCISTGYLEESFFRFYLLGNHEELGLKASQAVLVSTLMFALCHIYEGPWGFLNAILSSVVLSFVFLRYRSLHGIAFAHGLYNMFVYVLSAMQV